MSAGADVAFFEAARSKEDVIKVVEALKPTPVLINLVQGGVTPDFSTKELEEMGVKLGVSLSYKQEHEFGNARCTDLFKQIYPTVGMMTALSACMEAYKHLKDTGSHACIPMKIREFFAILGLEDSLAIDKEAGGTTYTNGV